MSNQRFWQGEFLLEGCENSTCIYKHKGCQNPKLFLDIEVSLIIHCLHMAYSSNSNDVFSLLTEICVIRCGAHPIHHG